MPENTLLSLLSGGRYGTSADLPTIPETAHSFMDDLIANQDSQMPQVLFPAGKNIFGQPTQPFTRGDLESLMMGIVMPGQGASALTKGSPAWVKTMKDLELSQMFTPKFQRQAIEFMKKQRETGASAKYKDAPRRELEDIILKLDELSASHPLKQATKEKIEDASYLLNKRLYEGMSNLEKAGGMSAGDEINIKNAFNTLMDFIK